MRKKDKKFYTDAETGVRRLPVIENLPVKELTDQEICKLFFDRFQAEALIMIHLSSDQQAEPPQLFGRCRMKSKTTELYRRMVHHFDKAYEYGINTREIPEEEF